MPVTMSHKEWMKLTYGGRTARRSDLLKIIDQNLKRHTEEPTPGTLADLRSSIVKWMCSKGGSWRNSIRNRHNAVDSLYRQVANLAPPGPVDQVALTEIRNASEATLALLFKDAEMRWKNAFRDALNEGDPRWKVAIKAPSHAKKQYVHSAGDQKYGTAANVAGGAKNLDALTGGSLAAAAKDAPRLAKLLVSQIVPVGGEQSEVLAIANLIVPDFTRKLVAACIPLAGLMMPAAAAIYNFGRAAQKEHTLYKNRMHAERCYAGATAQAAFDSMNRMILREQRNDIFAGSVSTAEFGGKLIGVLADGGTATNAAIGLSANVAKLANVLRVVYRDVQEKNAVNKQIKEGVDLSIFDTCPLVGCYLICCAPTSVLMDQIADRFGQVGWMDLVEYARRHLDPLRSQAQKMIHSNRFEIPSLMRHPGVVVKNEKALKGMIRQSQNSNMVGYGWSPDGTGFGHHRFGSAN